MWQIILFIITAVLVVYEANCTCRSIAPGVEVHMTQLEDFARRRVDVFRTIYASTSVPYATSPQRTISFAAYLKLRTVGGISTSIDGCPVEAKYQWASTISSTACCGYDQNMCAQEQIRENYVGASLTPPTDLTNYRLLISESSTNMPSTSNVEAFVDSMLSESEANNIVFGNPLNDKWGVNIGQSTVNSLHYLVFAIADDSGDNTEPSALCLPLQETEVASSVAPPTSTQAPVTTTLPPTTTTSTTAKTTSSSTSSTSSPTTSSTSSPTTPSITSSTTPPTTSSTSSPTTPTTTSTTSSTTPSTTQPTTSSTTPSTTTSTTPSTTTSTTPSTTQSTTTSTTPSTTQSTTTSTTPSTTPSTTTTTPSTSMTTYMTTYMTTSNFLTTVESTAQSTTQPSAGVAAVSVSIALIAALIALQ